MVTMAAVGLLLAAVAGGLAALVAALRTESHPELGGAALGPTMPRSDVIPAATFSRTEPPPVEAPWRPVAPPPPPRPTAPAVTSSAAAPRPAALDVPASPHDTLPPEAPDTRESQTETEPDPDREHASTNGSAAGTDAAAITRCAGCARLMPDEWADCPWCGTMLLLGEPIGTDLLDLTAEVEETTYLALGGGFGSFVWVDHLRVAGVPTSAITVIGGEPEPYARFRRLCRRSQIHDNQRLRSSSDACPDNLWGWPSYGVREVLRSIGGGRFTRALRVAWQLFTEPTFAVTFVPTASNVYRSIDREAARIGYRDMWRPGRVRSLRRTPDGRYAVTYDTPGNGTQPTRRTIVARYVQLSLGYPALRSIPAVKDYRAATGDRQRVAHAYEPHDNIYSALAERGGTVLLQGRGIAASRILERLGEVRQTSPGLRVEHVLRRPRPLGLGRGDVRRPVAHHWELQTFNWPKACWGGELRNYLIEREPYERARLYAEWGASTTVPDPAYQSVVESGLAAGWYRVGFGEVASIAADNGRLTVEVRGEGPAALDARIAPDFVIDATGLEVSADLNPFVADLKSAYGLALSPRGGLPVSPDFEVVPLRGEQGAVFAAGATAGSETFAPIDSFLGLQYAALRSMDRLVALGAPGVRPISATRSVGQWWRWMRRRAP